MIVVDKTAEIGRAINDLIGTKVGVGWPESSAQRSDTELNNPTIAYILNNGAPEANIPARPALRLGVDKAKDRINDRMKKAARAALDGRRGEILGQLQKAGIETASHVKAAIAEGIPPPLADSTLRGRIRKRKSGRREARAELDRRAAGGHPGVDLAKPLFFSGELSRSVNWVILTGKKG